MTHCGRITENLSGSEDRTIKILDFRTFKQLQNYQDHSHSVLSVCFHPSGKYLLSGSYDKTIKVYDLMTQKVLFTLSDHTDYVYSVKFSPSDGSYFASGSEDKKVILWRFRSHSNKENRFFSNFYRYDYHMLKKEQENNRQEIKDLKENMKLMKTQHEQEIKNLKKMIENHIFRSNNNISSSKKRKRRRKIEDVKTSVFLWSQQQQQQQQQKERIECDDQMNCTCFLDDILQFRVDFTTPNNEEFKEEEEGEEEDLEYQIYVNNELVITSSSSSENKKIQIIRNNNKDSISFTHKFDRIGKNVIKIVVCGFVQNQQRYTPIFSKVVSKVHVESSSICPSRTKLFIIPRGRKEEEEEQKMSSRFKKNEVLEVYLSLVNQKGVSLRHEFLRNLEMSVVMVRKGRNERILGQVLSRTHRIKVEKEEELVRRGRLVMFFVCSVKTENLEVGEYVIGVTDFEFTKKECFSII